MKAALEETQDQQSERWPEVAYLSIGCDFSRGCHTWSSITGWTHSSYHRGIIDDIVRTGIVDF